MTPEQLQTLAQLATKLEKACDVARFWTGRAIEDVAYRDATSNPHLRAGYTRAVDHALNNKAQAGQAMERAARQIAQFVATLTLPK